jgi:hypothetical protein
MNAGSDAVNARQGLLDQRPSWVASANGIPQMGDGKGIVRLQS